MVIIHKERVAVPVPAMEPGTVFFDKGGRLMMVTDDSDAADKMAVCVDLGSGVIHYFYDSDIAIPSKIVTMEVQ